MPTTVEVFTREEVLTLIAEVRSEFCGLLRAYVGKDNEVWLSTAQAMEAAQVSRATLLAHRASRPDTDEPDHITYRKEGKKSWYARSSCLSYALRRRGLPSLAT